MSTAQLALGILAQLALLVAAISAGLVWFRRWVRAQVVAPVTEIKREVKPNEGHSLRDVVDRIEQEQQRVRLALAAQVKRYEDHLQLGHGGGP